MMLGLLLLLVGAVSGSGHYCNCTSCLTVNNVTYNHVADQGDRCGQGPVQGCLMVKGNDEVCVCHAPINVTGATTEFARTCSGAVLGDVSCISTASDFKAEMELRLNGTSNSRKVCDGKLMSIINGYPTPIPQPNQMEPNGNAWAWSSGGPVLNHFLDLASNACVSPNNCTDRTSLITDMLHYVGFGDDSIDLANKNYIMAVFETARAEVAWDYKPFQPTWENVHTYLNQPGGFKICDGPEPTDCTKKIMPAGFTDAFNDIKGYSYKQVTNCDEGDPDADCFSEYVEMKAAFDPFDYYNEHCSACSKRCVQHYIDNFEHKITKKLWTRAFFLRCFDMNPYFAGDGFGFDPSARKKTGPEWWIRGDSGVPMTGSAPNSMHAENINVYVI